MKPSLSHNSRRRLITSLAIKPGKSLSSLLMLLVVIGSCFAQDRNSMIAIVNDKEILEAEVDELVIAQLLPLQQQIYALRKSALENLVTRAVLEAEAKKRGIVVEDLRKQLTSGAVTVTLSQVEALYQENASAFAAMSPDEAKERLRLDLESQARMRNYRAALSALRSAAKIDVRLAEPRLPAVAFAEAATRGSREAVVSIIEFSDFQCPYCREAQPTIKQILKEYPEEVRMTFKHLPLDIHDRAFASAQAAFCAGEQNSFWQYHDALFAATDFSPDALNKLAGTLGLKLDTFRECLSSETSRAAVMKDLSEARRLGINSTPTFVVNGKLVRGNVGFGEFKELIDRELKLVHTRPRTAPPTQPSSQERK